MKIFYCHKNKWSKSLEPKSKYISNFSLRKALCFVFVLFCCLGMWGQNQNVDEYKTSGNFWDYNIQTVPFNDSNSWQKGEVPDVSGTKKIEITLYKNVSLVDADIAIFFNTSDSNITVKNGNILGQNLKLTYGGKTLYISQASNTVLEWNKPASWIGGKVPDIYGDDGCYIILNADVSLTDDDVAEFFSNGNEKITVKSNKNDNIDGTKKLTYGGKTLYISQASNTVLEWNKAENWIGGEVPDVDGEGESYVILNADVSLTDADIAKFFSNGNEKVTVKSNRNNKKLTYGGKNLYISQASNTELEWNDDASWIGGEVPVVSGQNEIYIILNADVSLTDADITKFFSNGNNKITVKSNKNDNIDGTKKLTYDGKPLYISQASNTVLEWNNAENWIGGEVPDVDGEGESYVILNADVSLTDADIAKFFSNGNEKVTVKSNRNNKKLTYDGKNLYISQASDDSDWNEKESWIGGECPNISGTEGVVIFLNGDMYAENTESDATEETVVLSFNESGTEEIHVYFNGNQLDVRNAIKIGSNSESTNNIGNAGNLYLHGNGKMYVEVVEFGKDGDEKSKTWYGNFPDNKLYLKEGLEFYVKSWVSPYHCKADIDNPVGTKFYLNASGLNINWYNDVQNKIVFMKDPIPYGEQTYFKIIDKGGNPFESGKTLSFERASGSTDIEYKYSVKITGSATWELGSQDLSNGESYSVSLPGDSNSETKIELELIVTEASGPLNTDEGIIITFRTPDGNMDMCEIRYIEGELLWTGASSTDILATGNWSYNRPLTVDGLTELLTKKEAIIGSGAAHYPEIKNNNNIEVKKLTVKNGAQITVGSSGTLTVTDSLVFEGNSKINAAEGTVVFSGENTSLSAALPEYSTFGTLKIPADKKFTTNSDLHITTSLTNNGTFNAGKVYIEPNGDTATITESTANANESSETSAETNISELICTSQKEKTLNIESSISVDKISLSGKANVKVTGNLTTKNINLAGFSKIDASTGTVTFAGEGSAENPSFVANKPELSKFGNLVVAKTAKFYTNSDLYITTGLANNGTFNAGKVYFKPNDIAIISGNPNDSVENPKFTSISNLICSEQGGKTLKINGIISVREIALSGVANEDNSRLTVKSENQGIIYLENVYNDAKYLVLTDELPTIKNAYITASESDVDDVKDKKAFFDKNWKYDDGSEYPIWKGYIDSDWNNDNNWNFHGVPTENTNSIVEIAAEITANGVNNPEISSDVIIGKLLIKDGNFVTLAENGNLTISETLQCDGEGYIDAANGTVTFAGSGSAENPSFVANKPEFSKFGSLVVAENANFYTASDLYVANLTVEARTEFVAKSLNVTKSLEIKDKFSATDVSIKPSEDTFEINASNSGNISFEKLSCVQGGKTLVINGTISVGEIALTGTQGNYLLVKTENFGTINLSQDCDASYLSFEKEKIVTIQTKFIKVSNSYMDALKADSGFKSDFVTKNWRYADQTEFIWTGKDNKWNENENWDFYAYPANNNQTVTSVLIPSGCEEYPTLKEDVNLQNANLTIAENASINFAGKEVKVKSIENNGTIDFAGSKVTSDSITNNGTVSLTGYETITGTITEDGTVCYYKENENYPPNNSPKFSWGENYKNLVIESGFSGVMSSQNTGIQRSNSIEVKVSLKFGDNEVLKDENTDSNVLTLSGGSIGIAYNQNGISIEAAGGQVYNGNINFTEKVSLSSDSGQITFNGGDNKFENGVSIVSGRDFTNANSITANAGDVSIIAEDFSNKGAIIAGKGVICDTEGAFSNVGTITAQAENISITAKTFSNENAITAETGFICDTEAEFTNTGTILVSNGAITVTSSDWKNAGAITSEAGDISITSADFENSCKLSGATGTIIAQATNAVFSATSEVVFTNRLTVECANAFSNVGAITAQTESISITAKTFTNENAIIAETGFICDTEAEFTNTGAITSEAGDISITSANFENSGKLSGTTGTIIAQTTNAVFTADSEVVFINGLTVECTNAFKNEGIITSEGKLIVSPVINFTNAGTIKAVGVEIDATGDFRNSGKIDSSNADIRIESASFTNDAEKEISAKNMSIESGTVTNAGLLTATGDLSIIATSITNTGKIKAQNGELETTDFENKGTIEVTSGNFSANVKNNFANNSQITVTTGKLLVNPVINFTNAGTITALGVEIVATGNFTNSGRFISENGDITITSASFENTQSSEISANPENTFTGKLVVTTATDFENKGTITAYEVEIVATGDFKNEGSFISENGEINITSANFENAQSSELSARSGKMTITATGDFTNAGTITAAGNLVVNQVENFTNSGSITAHEVEIGATGDFTNSGKIDSSTGLLKITAKSITTSGEINAQSGDFISTESDILFAENSASTFIAGLTVTSAANFENYGAITASGVEIKATGNFTNSGKLISENGDINITSANFVNAQSSEISANTEKITISATSDFTNAGTITASEVEIDATGDFTNSRNIDSSSGLLKITAKSITTFGEIKANSGDFISTESDILFAENSETTFEAGFVVTSAGNFENYGTITAYGIEIVATRDFTNAGNLISENGDISIISANFENASLSEIAANKDFVCNVTELFSNAGIITSASGKVDINTKSFINKNYNLETPAKIKTENGLINVTTSNFENSGDISAYLDFTCAEPETFTNAGTITSETGKIDVKAQIMENPGSLFAINGKIDIFTELFETTKEIFGKNIDINSQSSIFAGLVKSGAGDIYISSDLLITHPVEFCLGGSLIIGTVENPKNLVISSLDKNQNATEVKFSQNDDLESIETKVIVSGYAIIFNGNVTLSTNIDIANDFVLLNGITSGENSIYRDSITEIDGLFAYNLFGRGDFDFFDFPSDLPFSIEDNKLTTKSLSHEKYNTHFSIAEGKIISVGKNFYCNGVDLGLNTSAEWFLKIPGNDVATSAFAECYNASIKNCKVVANTNPEDYAWLSTENAKDETGNTNVAFSKAVLSSTEVSTISDNIIFIKFINELNGKEIKIENSCNEISAWLENFRFNVSGQISEDNPGIQFTGVYANPECTESTDGKGDLSTFYLKYEIPTDGSIDYRWNTDAIGNSYGSEESTDSSGNYKKVIPNIAFERALNASYAGLRDEHKNRLVSVGTDDIGSNPLFTETKDKASPVLIAVTLGQEQHETDASSQHHYDSHNFIDWQFSEPVEFENYPKNGISQIDSVDTSANSENIQATATFGKITNQGNGFVVAGLGSFSSGKITTGSKTGLGEVNAFYRNFALDVDEKGSSYNPKIKPTRLRLSIAGYVEEENPINYKGEIYNNWLGFIDSKNTTIPSGTFTMPSSISTSIIDKRGNRGEAMEQTVFVNDFLNRYDKEKTLYGTWDIDSPVVSSYMKENLTTIEFEEVIPVDFSQSLSAQGLEIHFLDNSSYNQFEGYSNWKWRTKIGWLYKNESTEITLPLDNKGGSRMTFAENKTGGGLRLSSIVDSIEALSCKNLDLEKTITFTTDFSQSTTYEAFFGKSEDLAFDVPYLSLRFSELSKEFSLNNNYELLYSRHDSQGNSIGFITDLAGNLLYDFTVNSPDKNPPKIFLSIGAVHKDKLYIMFSKKLDWKDSNGNADEGKLRRIVKSLSIFDSKGNDTGLIDYKKGSRTKIVTETEKSTGIEISLTRTISYEELKNLYIGVNVFDSRDELIAGDGDKSKEDSISGEHGNFSMLYDLYENPASKDLKHCLSDFAVNALDVLYAYDGRVADEAILAQGVYGGNQWTVTNFTENKDNSSQIISDKDISIVSKIKDPASLEKQDKFSMIADISPNLQSTGSDFEIYTTINPRLWFTDYIKFFSTDPNNSENIEKDNIGSISGKIENIVSGDKNQNITFVLPNHPKNENSLGWGAGNEIQFLFKVFDKDGNPLMVDGNQDGDFEDDVDHPLFAVRLKDENDLTSIDLWSLNIVDILRQKGGVTILNNVINPLNSEECAIEITIPKAGNLTVQVLTLDGNVVKVIQRGRVEEGTYYYKWNGKNISGDSVARGMYFIRVVGPNIEETRKVMVVW